MQKRFRTNIDGIEMELSALDLELYVDSGQLSLSDIVYDIDNLEEVFLSSIVNTDKVTLGLPDLPVKGPSKVGIRFDQDDSGFIEAHLDDEKIDELEKSDRELYLESQLLKLQRNVEIISDKLDCMNLNHIESKLNESERIVGDEEAIEENEVLKVSLEQLSEKIEALENQNKELKNENKELFNLNKSIEQNFKKHFLEFEKEKEKSDKYRKIAKKYKSELEKQNSQNETLKKNVEHLNSKKREYAKKLKLSTKKLEEVQDFHEKKDVKEEEKLVGSEFKIPNTKIWYLKQSGQESGPHAFEDLLQLKALGRLRDDDFMKKEDEVSYRRVKDRYEINARLEQIVENGELFYLVSRSEYRAPFYDVVRFFIDDKEFKAHCTSLSSGGCFLEVGKMDELFSKGRIGTLYFGDTVLKESIICDFQIMRVSESRPKGLGLKFENIVEKNSLVIEEYVSNFLSNQKKKSA